jgi:tryptophan synthase alpha chain
MTGAHDQASGAGRGTIFSRLGAVRPGLALFLNAGDPSFGELRRLVLMLDECGVECLELAVPFPNSVTDGPVIRRSAARAIAAGGELSATLSFVAAIHGELSRLKIVLMADWRHTVRAVGVDGFLDRVVRCGCDGLLLHGIPPRARAAYYELAHRRGLPIVTTCFAGSSPGVIEQAGLNASAYVYLASRFGRGEGAESPDRSPLAPTIDRLREITSAPIAVGFGIGSARDVRAVADAGADAAIVGSACVACLEDSLMAGRDPVSSLRAFVTTLR